MRKHELHVMTTGQQELQEFTRIAASCETGLIDVLHLREKQRGARELTQWYEALKPLFAASFIYLNDRLDAALAVQAPGIQLAYNSLSVNQSRRIMPAGTRIGCSVHSKAEAVEAARQGADYVMFGHIYETGSKPGLAPRGLIELAEVVEGCPVPVIAIGGINLDKVEDVLSTGCQGIAVLSSIWLHPEPEKQIIRYRQALNQTQQNPRRGYH